MTDEMVAFALLRYRLYDVAVLSKPDRRLRDRHRVVGNDLRGHRGAAPPQHQASDDQGEDA